MSAPTTWHGLGRASKKEATRDEILQQAAAERAARGQARAQTRAATLVQAAWRGSVERRRLRSALLAQWHEEYAAAAASPSTLVPGRALRDGAVRLLLAALLPHASCQAGSALISGEPLQLQQQQRGSSSVIAGAGNAAAAVRGTLALVLRSVSAAAAASSSSSGDGSAAANTCSSGTSYVTEACSPDSAAWKMQAVQLCQLCCLVLATAPHSSSSSSNNNSSNNNSGTTDPVTDAAAVRVLQLLTSTDNWGNSTHAAEEAAVSVLSGLAARPQPLLRSVRRLVAECVKLQAQRHTVDTAGGVGGTPGAGGALQPAAVAASGLQRLLTLCCRIIETTAVPPSVRESFSQQLVLLVLTSPGLASVTPAPASARLLQPQLLCSHLLPAAQGLTACGRLVGQPALHCLANLAQLLTGCSAKAHDSQPQNNHHQQQLLVVQPSRALEVADVAAAYCLTATHLLAAAASSPTPRKQQQRHKQQHKQPQQQLLFGDCASDGAAIGAHVLLESGCWMLGSQPHLLQLQRVLCTAQPEAGMPLWCAYVVHLLQDGRAITSSGSATGNLHASNVQRGLADAVLNVLAFAPGLLLLMWRWLAVTAGLPLEAPLQASRGLDVAAVSGGPAALDSGVALVMGVFCRALVQLLLVLDDADLHEHGSPMNLATSRAMASSLNSLVFHTAFPESCRPQVSPAAAVQQQQQQQHAKLLPASTAHGRALLAAHAPAALRGFYERDARRPFCQPLLWTQPYHNLMARLASSSSLPGSDGAAGGGGSALAMTAAVVQALLVSLAGDDGDSSLHGGGRMLGSDGSAAAPPLAAGSAHGVPGLRTGALLSLLRSAPQCVPFPVRLELFRRMLAADRVNGRWGLSPADGGPPPLKLDVRRDALLEDAFHRLAGTGGGIRARLQVAFFNSAGLPEAGIDHGGLTKELLEAALSEGCRPERGLFAAAEGSGLLYPHPAAEALPQGLALLQFLGLLVGKAIYEGLLVNIALAPFFVSCLQGGRPGLDDLAGLDPALHASLVAVKCCAPEDVEHLGLTFEAEQQLLGRTLTTELLPGGASLPVSADNRLLYVHLLADWHLNTRLGRGAASFAAGLACVLPSSWLRMFSPSELNQLISGGEDGGVDVNDMQRYAQYGNGYNSASHTVRLFWQVVADFTPTQRGMLLRFITSSSRAPLGGFKHLQPPLTIAKVDCGASPLALLGGKDVDRLPSASTCFNTLKLPNYRRGVTLRRKLLDAISAGAGFELS